MTIKPHMKQDGELRDTKGIPIYRGDLIRSFHFTGPRRKKFYLYHVAVYQDGALRMVPVSNLEPTKRGQGGDCLMSQELLDRSQAVVLAGSPVGDAILITERKR